MRDFGTVRPGTTLYIPFSTYDSNDPSASVTLTGLAVGDILVYKDGSVTQRASTSGFTLLDTDGIDFDAITGIHGFSIDLADNTTANFWASGSQYWVVVASVTVDAGTINFIAATFRIGYPDAILNTTIATLASQTSFTLTAGPADDNALVGCPIIIHDVASAVQMCIGYVSAYTGSTKTVTLAADPAIFTMAAGDNVAVFAPANVRAVAGLVTNGTNLGSACANYSATRGLSGTALPAAAADSGGGLPISDAGGLDLDAKLANTNEVTVARMGALTDWIDGGRLDLIIDSVLTDTAEIGTAGAGLTAVPWNAAWDAEVQSEVDDALVARSLDKLVTVSGTADSGTTTTMVDAARTEADADYWKGSIIVFTSGTISGQARIITDFNAGTDTITFAPATTQSVGTNTYIILPGISVWDDTLAEHLASGTTGNALNAAGSAGDPWSTALPGAYGAGTAGFIVGTNLDTTVSSRSTLTQTQVTGGAYALNSASFAFNAALDLTTTQKSSVNAEADTALADIRLDELLAADSDIDGAAPPTVGSVFHELMTKTAGSFTFDQTTDSLEAIRDRGDAAWITATGFSTHSAADVWTSGTRTLTDTTGFSLSAAGIDAIWDEPLAAHTTADTPGQVVNMLTQDTVTLSTDVALGSIIGQLLDNGTAWSFDRTTDSLEALRDRGDAAWITSTLTVGAIADAVLDEDMTAHLTTGTLGAAIGDPGGSSNSIWGLASAIYDGLISITGTVNDAGATTTVFNTNLTQADDYWNDALLTFTSGAISGQTKPIADFANTNGQITLDEPTTSAPANGVTFSIIRTHVHPITQIGTGVWASATRTLTAGTNIQLPSNGLDNITAWTVAITGNITGNLSGSVGSVTGSVGSVTGNVGGNVVGSVASVTGAVGSVTGNVGGNVTGSIGSLATQAKADVNTEADAALSDIGATSARMGYIDELAAANIPADVDQIKADLPSRVTKNTALANFEFLMVDETDGYTAETGLTITATRSIDGAAFAACANSASEVSNGIYKINLAAADLNGDVITLKFAATGARTRILTIVTQP